jgi:hypothetical protein
MAIDIIETPGDPDANSYVTVADADAYHQTRPASQVATWTAATADDKAAAVVMATELLDANFMWNGTPTSVDQALAFPRTGLTNRNGVPVDPGIIPRELKRATSEFARQLLTGNRTADNDVARMGLTDLKAGPISLSFKEGTTSEVPAVIPDAVRMMIPVTWYRVSETAATATPTILLENT